jgi:hypothetical protein
MTEGPNGSALREIAGSHGPEAECTQQSSFSRTVGLSMDQETSRLQRCLPGPGPVGPTRSGPPYGQSSLKYRPAIQKITRIKTTAAVKPAVSHMKTKDIVTAPQSL